MVMKLGKLHNLLNAKDVYIYASSNIKALAYARAEGLLTNPQQISFHKL